MDEDAKKIVEQVKLERDVFNKAKLLRYLNKVKDLSIVKLSRIFSIKPAYICNLLRLLKLPEIVIDGYYSKIVSLSHLMTISRLRSKEEIISAYEDILTKNLTVEKANELVREKLFQIKTGGERIDKDTKRKIEEKYKKIDKNIQIKIVQTRVQARIILIIKGNMAKTTEVLKKIVS